MKGRIATRDMELTNASKMVAGYTLGMEPSGREFLVVAVKGTFAITQDGSDPSLTQEQVPLVDADIYTGDPGRSAPLYEVDFAPIQPRCDVLLHGSAYAPGGRPVGNVPVRLRVGNMAKEFNVVGDRIWRVENIGYASTSPMPFHVMPITYDRAFGGSDDQHPDPNKHSAYMSNPIGRGYHANTSFELMHNTPLPNTEELGRTVKQANGTYKPMGFGVIGRSWEPRLRFAGTYDQDWIDNVFPFLPADFDASYYQAAPLDQQIDYIQGGEIIELVNLTPHGRTVFRLPRHNIPVVFILKNGGKEEKHAVADTLVLEPDVNRFTITWRAHLVLRKDIFEVAQILVGSMSRGWWRARNTGKTYFRSLSELVDAQREEAGEA